MHAFYRQILLFFPPWNFRPGFAQGTTGISTSNHHSNTKNQKFQALTLTRSTKSHKSLERCVNFHVAFMPRCRISERRASRTRTSWDEVLQTKQDPMKKPISLPSWLLLAHGSEIFWVKLSHVSQQVLKGWNAAWQLPLLAPCTVQVEYPIFPRPRRWRHCHSHHSSTLRASIDQVQNEESQLAFG